MGYKWIGTIAMTLGLGVCPSLQADMISINLVSNTLMGAPGDNLTFQGSITNNGGADLFINGAGITLTGFGPADSDITDFVLNSTGPLGNGNAIGPFDFFTVTVPTPFASGQYGGILSIQGGPTGSDDSLLGTISFHVNVNSVPEPSSFSLIAAAMFLALLVRQIFRLRGKYCS